MTCFLPNLGENLVMNFLNFDLCPRRIMHRPIVDVNSSARRHPTRTTVCPHCRFCPRLKTLYGSVSRVPKCLPLPHRQSASSAPKSSALPAAHHTVYRWPWRLDFCYFSRLIDSVDELLHNRSITHNWI